MDIALKLNKIQKEISKKIPDINSGGCIHFAYYLSQKLHQLQIPHKIAFVGYDPINLSYDFFEPVYHVMVYIDSLGFIDGEKTVDNLKFYGLRYKKVGNVSLLKLNFFRKELEWNPTYDIVNNKLIKQIINKHLNA